ncbi:T9SS type A sorting domain-containing protein [bacterium]|nr:T9SS type A sorting domain-containing protein [bacterium]
MKLVIALLLFAGIVCGNCPGGYALQFDGVNDYVRIADAFFDGQETNSFTVECWFQTANDNQQYGSFIWNKTAFWQEAYLSYCCDRSFSFLYAYQFAYNNAYVEHFPLQTGQWRHLAASMENSTLRLFLDGQMIASSATNGLMSWATDVGTNRIGGGIVSGNSYYFEGAVDEMRFSSVARYVADFSVPTEPFANDQFTEALYHFDEGTGNTLTDASGNNHHGTLIDDPQWICSDAQLPIHLLSFTATPSDNRVTLNWSTGSESNVSHFEIDRDGASLARVEATNQASGHAYTWLDDDVTNGRSYNYKLTSVDLDGSRVVHGTVEATPHEAALPMELTLLQNYPNPFNASTTIEYSLPEATNVSLKLFNLAGQEVAVLANGVHAAGRHVVSLNASDLASGIYFYRLESPMRSVQQKMVLLK